MIFAPLKNSIATINCKSMAFVPIKLLLETPCFQYPST